MNKKVIIDNKYEASHYINKWAISRERGVKSGDLRVIGGKLMIATIQYPYTDFFGFVLKNEVTWLPADYEMNNYTLQDVYNWKVRGL